MITLITNIFKCAHSEMTNIITKSEIQIEKYILESKIYNALQCIKSTAIRCKNKSIFYESYDFLLKYIRKFTEINEIESAADLADVLLEFVNTHAEIEPVRKIIIINELMDNMGKEFVKWKNVHDKMFAMAKGGAEDPIRKNLAAVLPLKAVKAGYPELAMKYSKTINCHSVLAKFVLAYSTELLIKNEIDLFILQFTLMIIKKKGTTFANDFFVFLMAQNFENQESKSFPYITPTYNFVHLVLKSIIENSKDQFKVLVEVYQPTWSLDSCNKELIEEIQVKFFTPDSNQTRQQDSSLLFTNIFNTVSSMFSQPQQSNSQARQNQTTNTNSNRSQPSTNSQSQNNNHEILELD